MRKKISIPLISGILILSIAGAPALAAATQQSQQDANRTAVIHRLEQLGATPAQANSEVSMLNQKDLATLAAHPQMIHKAGSKDTGRELFWGCVIILVVVGVTAICANL